MSIIIERIIYMVVIACLCVLFSNAETKAKKAAEWNTTIQNVFKPINRINIIN